MTSDGLWTYTFDGDVARKRGDGQGSRLARKGESRGCPPGSEARQNRLTTMTAQTGAVTGGFQNRRLEFKYDYLGRRVQKTVQEWTGSLWSVVSARRFLHDGFNLVAELIVSPLSSDVSMVRSYTWGLDLTGGLTAAGGVGGLVLITDHSSQVTQYLPSYDGNGNVAALLDADTGTVAAAYEYSPFGEPLRAAGTFAKENPFRFSTKFTDDETGLVHYNTRYYSATLGRFLNRDTISEQGGLNLYAYVTNNPANRWDRLGRAGASQPGFVESKTSLISGLSWEQFWNFITGNKSVPSGSVTASPFISPDTGEVVGSTFTTWQGGKVSTITLNSPSVVDLGGSALSPGIGSSSSATTRTGALVSVTVNGANADIPGGQLAGALGFQHRWITTSDGRSAGMGNMQGVPGENGQTSSDLPFTPTQVVDHADHDPETTETVGDIDEDAVNNWLQPGLPTGPWVPLCNDCNTFVDDVIKNSQPRARSPDIPWNPFQTPVTNESLRTTVGQPTVILPDGTVRVVRPTPIGSSRGPDQ